MVKSRAFHNVAIFLEVVAVLVGHSHCFQPTPGGQQVIPVELDAVINNELDASELAASLLITQATLLKIINDSSGICSLYEGELQDNQDQKLELDVKTKELKNELKDFKQAALNELQNMKTSLMTEINARNEEAKQVLKEVKAAASVTNQRQSLVAATTTPQCEEGWRRYQSSCYKVFKIEVNNVQARVNCRAYDAYLASIGNWKENNFVHGLIESYTYIGLTDEGHEGAFRWTDGSPYSYTKWGDGEPSHHDEDANCVYMDTDSKWFEYECSYETHYICEKSLQ